VADEALVPLNSRYSQARAVLQSRIAVMGEMFNTSAWVKAGKRQHRIIQQDQIGIAVWPERGGLVQRYVLDARAAFQISSSRVVDEDAAHKLCGNRKKVGAIFEAHAIAIDQAHIRFIDQRSGLERDVGPLAPHIVPRQPPQFSVDDGSQFLQREFVPITPLLEQHGHFAFYGRIQDEPRSNWVPLGTEL
jgi:hypothetical protein